jgi:hypothetical protein
MTSDTGQGKSNTIFSSSITVSDAIHAANNLKAELKFTELETNFENTQSKQHDEEQTKISFEIPS